MGWLDIFRPRKTDGATRPPPRKTYNVERVVATVTMKTGEGYTREFVGEVDYFLDDLFVRDAWSIFSAWREDGRTGTLSVGGGAFVPLCNVSRIDTTLSPFHVYSDNTPVENRSEQ